MSDTYIFKVELVRELLCFSPTYLFEVALQQASKAGTVAGLVFGHLVNSVVDGIEASSLGVLGNAELVLASTGLGSSTLLKVGLGVPHAFSQKFSKTAGMVGLLKSIATEGLGYLGIALSVGLTSHGQIHTYFAALAIEVAAQVFNHLFADTFGLAVANLMDRGISLLFLQLGKLRGRSLTDWALLGCSVAFIDISTNGADKLLLHSFFFKSICLVVNE